MNSKLLACILPAIAVTGFGAARWMYPEENGFSIMRCTISFLGSPDADRNPEGWRWYQIGMTALILLMAQLIRQRHRNLVPLTGTILRRATTLYAIGFFLILISVWIPDSRDIYWAGIRTGSMHNRAAIAAVFVMMAAVIADAWILTRAGLRGKTQWPFRIFGLLWIAGIVSLVSWEWKCRNDPSLKHWPGDGIHSTPMWEWILFTCLFGFMIWIARLSTAEKIAEEIQGRSLRSDSTLS